MAKLRVMVAGAGGRMGLANIRAISAADDLTISGALDREGSPALGRDAGELAGIGAIGVKVTADSDAALTGAEAIVDFTTPAASVALGRMAAERGLIHVIGTTGLAPEDEAAIAEAGQNGARIVKAGNFSLGINLMAALVRQAAAALGAGWDAEILEMHHNRKVDAPSGTALMLGQAVAEGHGVRLSEHAVMARQGQVGARKPGEIGFATLRGGNVVGDHTVMLIGPNERLEFRHVAEDRALFADGAVKALKWGRDKAPGLYDMADVLGLK